MTARRRKQQIDLATVFQAVSANLSENQANLNQADDYNHNHGDNMVEVFDAINEAVAAKKTQKPAEQLAYASQLVEKRSQSGSAKMYASGLAQASQQFKGKAVTPDNLSTLLGTLLGGQAQDQTSSGATMDLLGSLLGGMAGAQAGSGQPAGVQGASSQSSSAAGDLIGALLDGAGGSQSSPSQAGLDIGDLLNAGKAFMNSQQQGEGTMQSIIKAFVAATQAGQSSHRAQSGELVASTIVDLLAKQGRRTRR